MANITNSASNTIITGSFGDDSIFNDGDNVSIFGGAGNDEILNYSDYSQYSNYNDADAVLIDGGSGNDSILYSGMNVTINGGTGDDSISQEYVRATMIYVYKDGDGNDTIRSFDDTDTLFIASGDWSTQVKGNDVIVTVGDGSILLTNAASLSALNITSSASDIRPINLFDNSIAGAVITGTADKDYIRNGGDNVSINAGAGNDTIYNDRNGNTTIVGGTGDDSIYNEYGKSMIYVYNEGDGNDTIYGFDDTDTLFIASGTWSTQVSGSDLIVTVGDGKITLEGAAYLSAINIVSSAADVHPINIIRNTQNDALVTGTAARDSIRNVDYSKVTIDAGSGDDSITYRGRYVYINGGDGDDSISNYADGENINFSDGTIDGGAGNDIIYNGDWFYAGGTNMTLDGGEGDDSIRNYGGSVTIDGGAGNDYIYNGDNRVTINGGAGYDTIRNSGNNVTINGDASNDLISLYSDASGNVIHYVAGDGGNDIVYGYNVSDTVSVTGGSVTGSSITGNNLILQIGTGTIRFVGAKVVNVNGTAYGETTRAGTDANDNIVNLRSNITINGMAGNDTIDNGGAQVLINAGDGNNRVRNYGSNVTISAGDGNDTIRNYEGDSLSISVGDGDDSVYNYYGDNISVSAGDGNDTVYNYYGDNISIDAGAGDDSVDNWDSSNVSINTGAGNDYVDNNWSDNVTINTGAGNDSIANKYYNVSITGGAGNDSIRNFSSHVDRYDGGYGDSVTIDAGTGDDYIDNYNSYGRNVLFKYKTGDGNDTIYGFNETSTLSISGEGYSTQKSGSDVIVSVGDGSITLTGAASLQSLNIAGVYKNPLSIIGTSGADSIVNILAGATIQALDGNDRITNKGANSSISGGTGKDTITNTKTKVTIDGGTGNDRIVNSAASVTLTGGTGNDLISLGANAKNNLITYTAGNDSVKGFNTTSTLQIGNGSVTYTKETDGEDIILTVGADKITLIGAASLKTLNIAGKEVIPTLQVITNDDATPLTLDAAVITADASKRTKAIKITGNAKANSIVGGSKADTLGGGKGNDTLTGGKGTDIFVYTAGKDAITDYAEGETISIASGTAVTSTSGDDLILTVGNGSISVKGAANKTVTYVDKGGEHTYPEPNTDDGVIIDGKTITLTEDYTANTFNVVDYGSKLRTIDASAVQLDINIKGNSLMNKIIGGDGNDTLEGDGSNDTLTGGKGSDVFLYNAGDGNDLITDYDEEDKLCINGAISKIMTTKGDAVVFAVDDGKISVTGGANKVVAYEDADGKKHFYPVDFNAAGTGATLLPEYTKDNFDVTDYPDYAGTLKTIDASAVESDIVIIANKLVNKIIAGTGNDTLVGGKGNDNLTGGAGADVFLYESGDGNDLITDYAAEDIVRVNGTVSKKTTSGKNVILAVGSNKISLQGAADKVITFTDNTAEFNDAGTAVTLTNKYIRDSFDTADYGEYAGTVKTVNASAVTHDLIVTGNKLANKILGGNGNDTLIGGKGNDSLNGGEGADVYIYNSGDGNDTIAGYAEEDKLRINGTVSKKTTSGKNIILTVGDYKITLKGAAGKVITYTDNTAEFNDAGTAVTLTNKYTADAFDVANYPDYAGTVKTINGAAVTHDVSITANSKTNTIYGSANNDYMDGGAGKDILYGGEGNDTLLGGTGNDTLWGGDGTDVFLYRSGGGNDVISDYAEGETISVTGAAVDNASVSGSNVVLTIGANKITVKEAKGKTVTYFDSDGAHTYGASNDLLIDDNYSANAAQLSQIVEPVKASYTPYDFNETMRNAQCVMRNELVPSSLFLVPNK